MPEITTTCVRCTGKFAYMPRRGPRRIRCDECARAAKLEGWRVANRRATARARRLRAFGPETPKVSALVDEIAGRLAEMDTDTRMDTAAQILRRFGLTIDQVGALVELAEAS